MWWPFSRRSPAAPTAATSPAPAFALDLAVVSDVGHVRDQNEDRGRSVRPGDAETLASKGVLVLVADGMGGHEAGDIASTTAADVVSERYYALPASPRAALERAFTEANARIYAAAGAPGRTGMGTTCTALVLRGAEAYWAHVGDSRLYRFRDGAIERLTIDHSMVAEMVAEGMLTEEEARHHDARNVITRALGIHPETEVTLAGPDVVAPGDVYVLMSDGLYDLVSDLEIAAALVAPSVHTAAHALVDRAKARGGHDNVTVAVVRVTSERPRVDSRETAPAPALS
ncbi:PP2C family protein-serine/threonine phosphatase [Rubrivirga sp. IMCC43871]|uniref:PP2C family protein-serine/threonine phosphatase n=1 Tax=Rubrivirga sp. IMCC43871 TaxID=3391575 RepID=UPI0039901FC0